MHVHDGEAEGLRVEVLAGPLEILLVLFVAFVGECFQQARVAPHATGVLRRTGALSGEATSEALWLGRGRLLEDVLVLPGVSEVVVIEELATLAEGLGERDGALVDLVWHDVFVVGWPIALLADSKAVQVIVLPCLLYTSDAADDLLCVDLGG